MDIVLAALMMIWGNVTASNPDLTFEQMVQASLDVKNAVVVENPGTNLGHGNGGQNEPVADANGFIKIDPAQDTPPIKGVYSTAHSAGGARLNELLKLLNETELNALVIDIKDDWGNVTYLNDNEAINSLGTAKKIIPDIDKLMTTLKENEIYPIARIVVFKDTILAKKKPEWSFLRSDGSVWANNKSTPESFVNPYRKEVWDYNIEVAKEAAKLGFKEIQFDYVRFPEGFEKKADSLRYDTDDRSRVDIVADFVQYAREQLNPLGVRVSVDIFGYAASVPAAEGIGQDFEKISKFVDVICPMIYPSHYSTGWFGSKVPDAEPYITIAGAMVDTHKKLESLQLIGQKPVIRPWIQDFTAKWISGHITYGKKEMEEQIRALKDNGVDEYLLWNSGNRYTQGVEYQ
jgi:hypothetical protein